MCREFDKDRLVIAIDCCVTAGVIGTVAAKCSFVVFAYLFPGPVISGHPVVVQNSLIVPYTRFTCSNSANAKIT